jgi:hypothetical protein
MTKGLVSKRSPPFGTIILVLIACALCVLLLASATAPRSSGDAVVGDAFEMLYLTFGLWVVLAILLFVGGVMGEMPRWVAILAIFVHPLSGVATITALDSYSRHLEWAIIFPVLLPLITALYAIWARLPALHARFPPRTVSFAAWGGILVLSAASLLLAAEF